MADQSEFNSKSLDLRRRRLRFRAWHRGMREVDLLLGRFADATLATLDETDLASFEGLLEVPDRQVLAWVTGESDVPAEVDSALLRRLLVFHGAVLDEPGGDP